MRLGHAWLVARMLLVFVTRKVLSVGLLRSRTARIILVGAGALLMVAAAVAATTFLKPLATDDALWDLVLQTSTVTAVLWTGCAFLFIKVLMMTSDGLLEFTSYLPVTARERAGALLMFEMAMVAACVLAGLFSVSVAAVFSLGFAAVPRLLLTMAVPVLIVYGALSLGYIAILRLLQFSRLRRLASLIAVAVLSGVCLAYLRSVTALTVEVSQRYRSADTSFTILTAPTWLASHLGTPAALALSTACLVLLAALILALTPEHHVRSSRYLKALRGATPRPILKPYDLCLLRSAQTWISIAVAFGLFGVMLVRSNSSPLWAVAVATLGGLYLFAATEPLRASGWDRRPAWAIYLSLLRAQGIIAIAGFVVGIGLITVKHVIDPPLSLNLVEVLARSYVPAGGVIVAIVVTTFISVMFPAAHDNPFSIFIGLSSTFVTVLLIATAVGLLGISGPALIASVVGLTTTLAAYTILGIHQNNVRRRHEKIGDPHQQRRGRDRPRPRRSRGNAALSHVH